MADYFKVVSALCAAVLVAALVVFAALFTLVEPSNAQTSSVSFGKSLLQGETSDRPTSLQFGPDGRLYAAQQNGTIKVYTIARNAANSYSVTNTQTIELVKNMPNHDDDGTLNTTLGKRQVLGILVTGTAPNPIIYVSSSDPRIGAGAGGKGDLNLDTNSGVISRLSWNGSSWNKVDLVRGLPRSEENHSTNGLQLDETTNTLYVAVGGNTNHGAPSNNFALLPEYALSAAVLSIDLDAITNPPYDVPTLNDEDRAGSPDANDPFGGNDGKNQARIVPGGPVQVFASGFRNPYDVLIAQSGKIYTIDNSGNAGWGDVPVNEGPAGNCTNDPNEPGTTDADTLHLISDGYYGGHPNPTRGNTNNKFNLTNPQSPVPSANPVECDYRAPGAEKGSLASFDESTNGLAEYTASNFGGAMTGDLLAAGYNNNDVYRIKLNAAGDAVVSKEILIATVDSSQGALDVTAQGDSDIFPGTFWVAHVASGNIVAFEPDGSGGGSCTGADSSTLDEDQDGFDNADEIDNGTNPCSAADAPPDNDGDNTSDLNDPNDDNDSFPDTTDPFAVDANNGKTTNLPVSYTWDNDAPNPDGLMNLGFTGLMTNKSSNYASLFDSSNMTAGGAAGAVTVDKVPAGEAFKTTNSQKYGLQFGVNATSATGEFTAHTRIAAPFAGMTPENNQSMGLFVGNGDQDNYVKLVTHANNGQGGLQFRKEVGAIATTPPKVTEAMPGPEGVDLYLTVDPGASTVQASYRIIGSGGAVGPLKNVGGPTSIPSSWFGGTTGFAVGIISTSSGPGPEFPATWEFIEVVPEGGGGGDTTAPVVSKAPTQLLLENTTLSTSSALPVRLNWAATDDSGTVAAYELQQSTDGGAFTNVTLPSATATQINRTLQAGHSYRFQVRAQDGSGNWSGWKQGPLFEVNVVQENNAGVSYTGTWTTETLSSASGGTLRHSSASGALARLSSGDVLNIGWVAHKGANRGRAEAWVDGVNKKSVDLYNSSTQARRVVFAEKGLNPAVGHTLEVKVLGTKSASSSGTRVDVDAFVILSSP